MGHWVGEDSCFFSPRQGRWQLPASPELPFRPAPQRPQAEPLFLSAGDLSSKEVSLEKRAGVVVLGVGILRTQGKEVWSQRLDFRGGGWIHYSCGAHTCR